MTYTLKYRPLDSQDTEFVAVSFKYELLWMIYEKLFETKPPFVLIYSTRDKELQLPPAIFEFSSFIANEIDDAINFDCPKNEILIQCHPSFSSASDEQVKMANRLKERV